MGTGATEPAEPADGRRPRPAKAAFAAPPERDERRAPQPRAGKVPPPMLFQAPPEEPVETVRQRTGKGASAGDSSAPPDGGGQLFTPPATDPPTNATPAKAPRPRKKAVAEPAGGVEPAVAGPPAKKAAPKKAAAAKRTPAARTADQPADAVKDPAPAETTPKIPARRKAVAAAAESRAKAAKKPAPKKTAAKTPTTQKAASDLAQAPTPDHGPAEEPVTLNNEAADSPSIAPRTEPVAETPAPATDGIEQTATEPVAHTPTAPQVVGIEPTATEQPAEAAAGTNDLAPMDSDGRPEPVVVPAEAVSTKPGAGSLWRVPEAAAAAAVKRFTPQADAWAREIRATYPTASPDGLARLAQQRFLRKTTAAGAAASFANGWSSAADLVATSWVNAELIAHIAAAYGQQATTADVLVLTGVHQDHESAQAAIDGTPGHSASRAPITAAGKTVTWAALKILGRWWPGLAAAGGAAGASLNTERVAARAIQRFRAS